MTPITGPKRRAACLRTAALAAGLVTLVTVALACGPFSLAGKGHVEEPTSTSTRTRTPTPTHQAELGTLVNAVMVKQATIAAAPGGVAAQAAQQSPHNIIAQIYTDTPQSTDIRMFLASHGVTPLDELDCGNECTLLASAEVTVSLLEPLSKLPGVFFIDTLDKYYEKLDGPLNPIVAQYDAGLITELEAVTLSRLPHWAEKVLVVADFDNSTSAHKALRYLQNKDLYMMPHPAETATIAGFVPVSLLLPLSQQPGAVVIMGYGYGADLADPEVQEELNQYKPSRPASDAGDGGNLPGLAHVVIPASQPTLASPAILNASMQRRKHVDRDKGRPGPKRSSTRPSTR